MGSFSRYRIFGPETKRGRLPTKTVAEDNDVACTVTPAIHKDTDTLHAPCPHPASHRSFTRLPPGPERHERSSHISSTRVSLPRFRTGYPPAVRLPSKGDTSMLPLGYLRAGFLSSSPTVRYSDPYTRPIPKSSWMVGPGIHKDSCADSARKPIRLIFAEHRQTVPRVRTKRSKKDREGRLLNGHLSPWFGLHASGSRDGASSVFGHSRRVRR
jgi:hypothetical protein